MRSSKDSHRFRFKQIPPFLFTVQILAHTAIAIALLLLPSRARSEETLRAWTLAPKSTSQPTLLSIQKELNLAASKGYLKYKPVTDAPSAIMGFKHFIIDDESLTLKDGRPLDPAVFFDTPVKKTHSVRLVTFADIPVGVVLVDAKGNLLEQYGWNDQMDMILSEYHFFLNEQQTPLDERYIVSIGELEDSEDCVKIAGGKGASLGELEKAKGTAEGFVLTVASLDRFWDANPKMRDEIQRLIYSVDTQKAEEREKIAERVHALINGRDPDFPAAIPDDIREPLLRYYTALNLWMEQKELGIGASTDTLSVAIRSSGTAEDRKVEVPWAKTSTGSEAGIGETSLGVRGIRNVFRFTQWGWSSLLTDRAFSYREFQAQLELMGEIGQEEFEFLISRVESRAAALRARYAGRDLPDRVREEIDYLEAGVTQLKAHSNMGYKRLNDFLINQIESESNETVKQRLINIRNIYNRRAAGVMNLKQLGQALVVLRQLDSSAAGTSFTAITNTGFTGSHLKLGWDPEQGRVMAVELDIAQKQGEGVVGSLTTPDHFELVRVPRRGAGEGDPDPYEWVFARRTLGPKEVQVVLKDRLFSDYETFETQAGLLDFIFTTDPEENRERVLAFAPYLNKALSDLSAEVQLSARLPWLYPQVFDGEKTREQMMEYLQDYLDNRFDKDPAVVKLVERGKEKDVEKLRALLPKIIDTIQASAENRKEGMSYIEKALDMDGARAERFVSLMGKAWIKKSYDEDEVKFLSREANLTPLQAASFAMMAHPDWLEKGTVAIPTPRNARENFVADEEAVKYIATQLADIGEHYARRHGFLDKRDLEWALETSRDGEITVKIIDPNGFEHEEKVVFKPLQARPVTSRIVDESPHVRIETTEVDQEYIKKNGIEPFCKGVPGVGAATGDLLYFVDDHSPLGPQEDEVRRLAQEEWEVVDVIEFGGPQHDPLMKAANGGVLTAQGGGTSHVAIFCREQGIVAVTGIGSEMVAQLREIQERRGKIEITIDANNGQVYLEKIPIKKTVTEIKVPFLPKLKTRVGLILGSPIKAQKLSRLSNFLSGYGISLARGEFIAEQMGVFPKGARAYYLLNLIQRASALEHRKPALEAFEKERLPALRKLLEDNPDLEQKFESMYIEEIPATLDRFPPILNEFIGAYADYLMWKDLQELKKLEGAVLEISNKDLEDIARFQAWARANPEKYEDMVERFKGFETPREFVIKSMADPQSAIALSLNIDTQVNQNRAFDNKPNELALLSAEAFSPPIWVGDNLTPSQRSNPYNNPLIGLRGISLLNRPDQREAFNDMLRGIFESVSSGVPNQGFMNVFIRTPREVRLFLDDMETLAREYRGKMIEKHGKDKGSRIPVMPREVGLMIEVPSNLFLAEELAQMLLEFRIRCREYGLENVYFSFGTNDLTNLSTGTDRDDPKVQNFEVKDPWVLETSKQALEKLAPEIRAVVENARGVKLPLPDEGSSVLRGILRSVVAAAKDPFSLALAAQSFSSAELEDFLNRTVPDAETRDRMMQILAKNPFDLAAGELDELNALPVKVKVGLCGQAIVKGIEGGDILATMKLIALLDSFGTDDKNLAQAAMTAFDADHLFAVIENKEALSPLAELENVPVRGAVTGEVVRVSSKEEIMPERYQKLSDREKARLAREDVWQTTRVANRVVVVDGPLGSMSDFVEIRDPETGEVTQKKTEWDDLRYAYAILVDTSYWRERHGDDFEAAMKEDLSVLFDTPQLKNRVKGIGALPEDLLAEGSAVAVSFTDKAVYPGENARLAFEEPSIDKLAIPDVTVDEVKRVEGGTFSTAEVFREMKRHPLAEWNKLGDNAGRTFIERFKTVFLEKFPKPDRPVQWLNETLDRATLFDKEEGVSTEVQLNENPRFGLRDTNRYLNDFWPINHAQITAIRELLKEGYTIHYSISNLRNIRDQREVLAATLAALAEGGVLGHKNFKVGVNLSTLANVMQAGDYLKWVDYLAVDFENLAYNLNALDPVAQEKVPFGIIKDDEIMAILPRPFRLILGALLDAGKPIFLDAESAPPMLERISREDRRLRTKKEMARALTLLRTELEDTLSPETIRDLRELAFRLQTLSYRPVFDRDTVRRVHDALAQDDTLPERFPEFWLELKDFLRAEMMAAVSEEERQEQESVEKRTLNITPGSNTPWLLERFAQNGIHKSA